MFLELVMVTIVPTNTRGTLAVSPDRSTDLDVYVPSLDVEAPLYARLDTPEIVALDVFRTYCET